MIDLAILILIGWGAVIGWKRGGIRSLVDCMSAGGAIAVMVYSIPYFKDSFIDASWAPHYRRWIKEHLHAVPTGFGFDSLGSGTADRLYHYIIVGAGAAAVFVGIQIILQVYQTVWTQPAVSTLSRVAGSLAGSALGGIIAFYMVQCLGLLSWVKGLEALDVYLNKSFLVWLALNYLVM